MPLKVYILESLKYKLSNKLEKLVTSKMAARYHIWQKAKKCLFEFNSRTGYGACSSFHKFYNWRYSSIFLRKRVLIDRSLHFRKAKKSLFSKLKNHQLTFVGKLKTFQNQPKDLTWVGQKLQSTPPSNKCFFSFFFFCGFSISCPSNCWRDTKTV